MLTAATIKHLNQLQQKKYRAEFKEFIVEGLKGVEEAISSETEVVLVIIDGKLRDEAKMIALIDRATERDVPVDFCSRKDIAEIKTTDTFPGVLAVVAAADTGLDEIAHGPIIALDGVKDPGNLGTIIRTADWFGVHNVLLAEDTVDPFNPKVVRSTMGSLFRVAIFESLSLDHSLQTLKAKFGYKMIALDMTGTPLPTTLEPVLKAAQKNMIFLFGSESHGLRPGLEKLIDTRYTIPGKGAAESLNVAVAAAIVMSRL